MITLQKFTMITNYTSLHFIYSYVWETILFLVKLLTLFVNKHIKLYNDITTV